jgi:hypothetical protein
MGATHSALAALRATAAAILLVDAALKLVLLMQATLICALEQLRE